MLDAFKEAHKEREQLLSTGGKTAELRGDLAVMEREREIVASKVASLQKSRVRLRKILADKSPLNLNLVDLAGGGLEGERGVASASAGVEGGARPQGLADGAEGPSARLVL